MKHLIYVALIFLVLIFQGCESKILIMEQQIQPAKELDIARLGNTSYFKQSIYKKYFKRAFIFSRSYARF